MKPDGWWPIRTWIDRRGMLPRNGRLGGQVATDWTAISLAALGVAGTISGGFVGAWIQQRGQQWQERQRQRDLASEVVGTLVQLHGELTPDQVIPKKQDLTSQEIRQLDDETEALEVRSRAAVAQLFVRWPRGTLPTRSVTWRCSSLRPCQEP